MGIKRTHLREGLLERIKDRRPGEGFPGPLALFKIIL
jgi:hypothetical protein